MDRDTRTSSNSPSTAHGELACVDAEALLAEALAENANLRNENDTLIRRLDNAIGRKNVAIDEAVAHRSR